MMLLFPREAETITVKHRNSGPADSEPRSVLHLIKKILWTAKQKAKVCFAEMLLHEVTAPGMRTW